LPVILCLSIISTLGLITGMVDKSDTAAAVPAELTKEEKNLPYYKVQADFYPQSKVIEGKEEVSFAHFDPGKEVVFNLYLNSYNDRSLQSSEMRKYARARGRKPGYINIQNVYYQGKQVPYEQTGKILKVKMNELLFAPGEQTLTIDFKAKMPFGADRVGGNEKGMWLGNWLPTISVDGKESISTDVGDPFVNFSSTYEVSFSVPYDYNLVLSNTNLAEDKHGKRKTYRGKLEQVRDLPVFLNRDYNLKTVWSGKTAINYYYLNDGKPLEVLAAANEALEYFRNNVGEYPWKQLNIVQNDMYLSGMEYSTLILVSNQAIQNNLKKTVFHEIGHQWFYNIIGSDQYNAPFMDEGLIEFIGMNALTDKSPQSWSHLTGLNKSLEEFDSWEQYRTIHYRQGQKWFECLYSLMGQERFDRFIQDYYKKFKYDYVTPGEFEAFMINYTNNDSTQELLGYLKN